MLALAGSAVSNIGFLMTASVPGYIGISTLNGAVDLRTLAVFDPYVNHYQGLLPVGCCDRGQD